MPIVAADWTITGLDIRYIGDDHGGASPSYATVIEYHRWLQSLADDAKAVGDDVLDMTRLDPSRRSTDNIITHINGYNITAVEAEHLYNGSILQAGGDDIWDGIVNFGNADVQIQLIQDGEVLADDWWNFNGGGLNANATSGISHRFMIKTRTAGVDIDNGRILGTCRRFGYTYSEFNINATQRGNNVLALKDELDLNNATEISTVAGWTTISNSEGYAALDVDNNGTPEYYYSEWNTAGYLMNQFYERMKWLTRDGSASTLYGLNGELFRGITHQVAITQLTGTFVEPELLTWATGTGQLFAINSTTAGTFLWMQLLTGVIPDAETITGAGAATATSGTVTERPIKAPVCGASTGTALRGAYGFGVEVLDLTSNDQVTNLAAVVMTPPNYVTNTVGGIVSGEDRVMVAPWDGTTYDANGDPAIQRDQLSLSGTLTAANVTSVVVAEAIPSDTPSTGYIRLYDDDGYARLLHYSGWATSTFTIDTTDGNEDFDGVQGSGTYQATTGNDVHISYIDKDADATTATFTSVQSGTRNLVVLVRDGKATPIKQFISAWAQTSSPATINAIRTTDA